jgi:hypothetical protein
VLRLHSHEVSHNHQDRRGCERERDARCDGEAKDEPRWIGRHR